MTPEQIVRNLAARPAPKDESLCALCGRVEWMTESHAPDCPWRQAVEAVKRWDAENVKPDLFADLLWQFNEAVSMLRQAVTDGWDDGLREEAVDALVTMDNVLHAAAASRTVDPLSPPGRPLPAERPIVNRQMKFLHGVPSWLTLLGDRRMCRDCLGIYSTPGLIYARAWTPSGIKFTDCLFVDPEGTP